MNSEFGLSQNVLSILREYFKGQPAVLEVRVYGSRAMGNYEPGSDIDFSIRTSSAESMAGRIKTDLEDLKTPYLFDVTDYDRISHQPLKAHIDRVGKLFYGTSHFQCKHKI